MDFLELAKKRYSCRNFLDKSVEKEKILKILEAGRVSPTACNFQPQRILVLQDKGQIEKLKEGTRYTFNAPVVFVVCYNKNVSWKNRFNGSDEGIIDASIVTTHMMLEIADLGLGSTWVGYFDDKKIRNALNIPTNFEIVAIMPTGYKDESVAPNPMHEQRNDLT